MSSNESGPGQEVLQVRAAIRSYLEHEQMRFQEEAGIGGEVDSFLTATILPGPSCDVRCRIRATHHQRTFYLLVATGVQINHGDRSKDLVLQLFNSYVDSDFLTYGSFYVGSDREIYHLSSHYLHGPARDWCDGIGHTFHSATYDISRFFRFASEQLGDAFEKLITVKQLPRQMGHLRVVRPETVQRGESEV